MLRIGLSHRSIPVASQCQSCQPAGEGGQGVDEQQDLQPLPAPSQAVLHALSVAMGFEVAKRKFDLHAARVEIHPLPCAGSLQFGGGHDRPWLAFAC